MYNLKSNILVTIYQPHIKCTNATTTTTSTLGVRMSLGVMNIKKYTGRVVLLNHGFITYTMTNIRYQAYTLNNRTGETRGILDLYYLGLTIVKIFFHVVYVALKRAVCCNCKKLLLRHVPHGCGERAGCPLA